MRFPLLILTVLVAGLIFAGVVLSFLLKDFNLFFLVAVGALIYFVTLYAFGGIKKELLREVITLKND